MSDPKLDALFGQKVKTIVGPTILLRSGRYFDFERPQDAYFTVEDIAGALAKICRFTGQTNQFYSVAEHSVLVSRLVSREDAFAGLMHDAAEAFLGDVSSPLKALLPDYLIVERRVEAAIFERFQIPLPLPESVKRADRAMLGLEQRQLMNTADDWPITRGVDVPRFTIGCLSPGRSERLFLDRFHELHFEHLGRQK